AIVVQLLLQPRELRQRLLPIALDRAALDGIVAVDEIGRQGVDARLHRGLEGGVAVEAVLEVLAATGPIRLILRVALGLVVLGLVVRSLVVLAVFTVLDRLVSGGRGVFRRVPVRRWGRRRTGGRDAAKILVRIDLAGGRMLAPLLFLPGYVAQRLRA